MSYYIYAYIRNKNSKTATAGTPYYIGKGNILSDETKQRIREFQSGRKKSEQTKQKMKKPKISIHCPHCSTVGGKPAMMRWHFDHCKEKK